MNLVPSLAKFACGGKFHSDLTNLIGRTWSCFPFDPIPVGDISSVYIQLLSEFKVFFSTRSFSQSAVSNATIHKRFVRHYSTTTLCEKNRWLVQYPSQLCQRRVTIGALLGLADNFFCVEYQFSRSISSHFSLVAFFFSALHFLRALPVLYLLLMQPCQLRWRIF